MHNSVGKKNIADLNKKLVTASMIAKETTLARESEQNTTKEKEGK